MTSPSLVILAAGRGTRFGGVKQLAEVGADGDAVMDVLLRRAAGAGITHAVVVVSPEVHDQVAAHLRARRQAELTVELAVQAEARGTADALLAARGSVPGSCVVVNADDLYPADAFSQLVTHLRDAPRDEHAMVAFRVGQTMSGTHPGWRALVETGSGAAMAGAREGLVLVGADGLQFQVGPSTRPMLGSEWISMNIWAFRARVFDALAAAVAQCEPGAVNGEVLLPDVVAEMVGAGEIIRVLHSEEICIGLTHADDVAAVRRGLVTDTEAIGRVAAEFVLVAPVETVGPFGDGLINETFLVTTAAGDYVLQRINRRVFADPAQVMENIATVSRHLGGCFVPELVAARRGGFLAGDGYDRWRAWHRVVGAEPVREVTPARAASAANLLGQFHAGLADLEPALVTETLPHFHDPGRRLARLRDAVAADPHGRAPAAEAEIATAMEAAPLVQAAADLVARVPRRVAHNDTQLSNVVFRGDEAVCLVDLDTVMPTASFWDVGDLVRTASTYVPEDDPQAERVVVDAELLAAILDGYRTGRAIGPAPTRAEDEALALAGPIVVYEQALRFLTDWIAGDVYYRTTRPGQNRDRARAQLALLASMPGTVGS